MSAVMRTEPMTQMTPESDKPEEITAANDASPARLNDSEREALLLNIDVSLRVHTRAQLFSWVQGALQSLIPHEVLVCGLQEGRQMAMRVDSFSTAPVDCNDSIWVASSPRISRSTQSLSWPSVGPAWS